MSRSSSGAASSALLRGVGVALNLRASDGASDRGGAKGKKRDAPSVRCTLGARLAAGGEAKIANVYVGGPAHAAGLAPNDAIVALDGLKASPDAIERLLGSRRPGEAITVHAFRRDELFSTRLTLAEALVRCSTSPSSTSTASPPELRPSPATDRPPPILARGAWRVAGQSTPAAPQRPQLGKPGRLAVLFRLTLARPVWCRA